MSEWIVTEWTEKKQFENMSCFRMITIHRMNSPYYKGERFAVRNGSLCLSTDSTWDYETSPSNRDDAFYEKYRFKSLTSAQQAAEEKIDEKHKNGGKNDRQRTSVKTY